MCVWHYVASRLLSEFGLKIEGILGPLDACLLVVC